MNAPRGHCQGLRVRLARAGEGRPWRALHVLACLMAMSCPSVALDLPSGQAVTQLDRAVEVQADGAHWLILRYLAPHINMTESLSSYDAVAPDLDALCEGPGLATAAEVGPVDQIVIVLLDRPVPRGIADPEATQYISAYRPTETGCLWE